MPSKNVALAPELFERAEQVAEAEGKTVDELANEAVTRELARRFLDRTRREAESRRGRMTDKDVDTAVETAVLEWRREQRER